MSEENVEVVRRMYEAYLRGDTEAALACLHPEVVVDVSRRVGGRVAHGHDGAIATVIDWAEVWDEYSEKINEIRGLGSRVLVVVTHRGRGKGSGIEAVAQRALLFQVEGSLVTRAVGYRSREDALEAAGLVE